jgi:hypothetical protein
MNRSSSKAGSSLSEVMAPSGSGSSTSASRTADASGGAITMAVSQGRVATVRERGAEGVVCGVEVELMIGERTAPVTLSRHYADASTRR